MLEDGNVLAEVIHFPFFKAAHVFHLLHDIGEVDIKLKRFCLHKTSCEQVTISLQVQQVVT